MCVLNESLMALNSKRGGAPRAASTGITSRTGACSVCVLNERLMAMI